MTWPEIVEDLKLLWSWICWLANGAEWLMIRIAFVICVVALPVFVVAFLVGACYLKWKSEQTSA